MADGENTEILDQIEGKIENLLKNKRINPTTRAVLEIEQLLVAYLQNDHPKVQTMWRTYRPAIWAAGIVAAAFLTLLASGRVSIIIK